MNVKGSTVLAQDELKAHTCVQDSEVWNLCEEYFEWRLREYPEFSTFCGQHDYDDRLNNHSSEAFAQRLVTVEKFLARATELETQDGLSEADMLNLALLKDNLLTFMNGIGNSDHGPKGYYFVVNYNEGIHSDFEQLMSWMQFNTDKDFQKYLSRLKALPNRIVTDMRMLQEGVLVGCTQSVYSMDLVPEHLDNIVGSSPENTVFFVPFKNPPSSIDVAVMNVMKQEALTVIADDILPALSKLSAYIRQEYMASCRPREGIDSVRGGAEFYQRCLKWHTSLDVTPDEVHAIGVAEVARIQKEMKRVMEKTGFTGGIREFIEKLRSDDKFYFSSEDECLENYRYVCYDIIRPALPRLFPKIPESRLMINPSLPSKSSSSTAYYYAGTLDGS